MQVMPIAIEIPGGLAGLPETSIEIGVDDAPAPRHARHVAHPRRRDGPANRRIPQGIHLRRWLRSRTASRGPAPQAVGPAPGRQPARFREARTTFAGTA